MLIQAGAIRYEVNNQAWHRLNLMKSFSLNDSLRRDINVTNLETWLLAQYKTSSAELGDIQTKAPWWRRASSNRSFVNNLLTNCINSLEYMWLIYKGYSRGMSLGTLHLIRSSSDQILDGMWNLTHQADQATDEWKNLIAYFKCLELKSDMALPEDPVPYVSNPAGMKLEARGIRYKYDVKKDTEVLKGASFLIHPGEMIAVVGYASQ
jgi:ABC-type multidrug transport system fused ATPase/permease subunit